jgi:hypothetical protein
MEINRFDKAKIEFDKYLADDLLRKEKINLDILNRYD